MEVNVHSRREDNRKQAWLSNCFVEMKVSTMLGRGKYQIRTAEWLFRVSLLLLYGDTFAKKSNQSSFILTWLLVMALIIYSAYGLM